VSVPFARLMEYAASLTEEDLREPLPWLAAQVGEFPERLADAMIAVRVCNGVTSADIRAVDDPVVAQALVDDRGTIISGFGVDTSQEG
jgi:hypothetical protein